MNSEYRKTFTAIGNQIIKRWKQHSFDERALPAIATRKHMDRVIGELGTTRLVIEARHVS